MKFLHLKLIILLFLSTQSVLFSQIDTTFLFSNNKIIHPKSIERTNDNGYLVTGKENTAFILKLDSLFNIQSYTTYNGTSPTTIEDESLYKHTDSTFYSIFAEYIHEESRTKLASIILNHDGQVKQSIAYNFPYFLTLVNACPSKGNGYILSLYGSKELLIEVDSIGQIKQAKSYFINNQNHQFNKIFPATDSTYLLVSYSSSGTVLSTLNDSLNVINSTEILSYGGLELYVENDSIYLLGLTSEQIAVGLMVLDLDLNISSHNGYSYQSSSNGSKMKFIKVDSSSFIFYAGNSILEVSRNYELLNIKGVVHAFKDFYVEDDLTIFVQKLGLIPPIPNLKSFDEFVITRGNSIDTIMSPEKHNKCISDFHKPFGPITLFAEAIPIELFIDTTTIHYQLDSIFSFRESTINKSTGCPAGPSNTTENEIIELKLFPNPALHEINLESDKQIDQIVIYSFDGGIRFERNYFSNKVNVRLDGFVPGIYFVRVFQNGKSKVQKFVVM